MDKMERLLKMWIDNLNRQNMALSLNLICQKALSIIERLTIFMSVGVTFDVLEHISYYYMLYRKSLLYGTYALPKNFTANRNYRIQNPL